MTDIAGVLLAGGLARRMGGGDKPLKSLGGRTILARVIDRLRPQVGQLILNANGDPARFAAYGLPVVADGVPDYPGPLAGILAGMDWARARGLGWIASVSADAPFLPRDLVTRLHAATAIEDALLATVRSGGQTHPPIGLWSTALADDLRRALTGGLRKIDLWTARHRLATVDFAADPDPFFNANTPEDLAAAEALIATRPDL